jgi:ketosteroid isomerase-like protein
VSDDAARQLALRFVDALNRLDWAAFNLLVAPDLTTEWPQSGELVRGAENFRRIFEGLPGRTEQKGTIRDEPLVFDAGERWVMTPTFTTIRVAGGIERFSVVARAVYPGDEIWYVVNLLETRDGRITRNITFFAPTYPAPDWRAQWVERLEGA